jgi:hypothetical protein
VWGWLIALVVAALAGAGAGAALAMTPNTTATGSPGGGGTPSASSPSPSASSPHSIAVQRSFSFDPSGHSGISKQDGLWQTEHYASAHFGNLKKGVGLVLDLGAAKHVRAVRLNVHSNGLGLRLYALDSPPSTVGDLGQPVARASGAAGATTLRDSASGAHRYLVVWVNRLAPSEGRYQAVFGDVAVRG